MNYRIGQGFDLHQFADNRDLILGGIKIPYEQGLLGHSDADALCHAIIDALLGALALGDIGQHFPDTDAQYYGCDSTELLAQTLYLVMKEGYRIINIDTTIKTQQPKLGSYILEIRKNLADVLNIDIKQISVKAKTMEKMGPIGECKCLAVDAVALLEKIKL